MCYSYLLMYSEVHARVIFICAGSDPCGENEFYTE